jgi:hypothetical protein
MEKYFSSQGYKCNLHKIQRQNICQKNSISLVIILQSNKGI